MDDKLLTRNEPCAVSRWLKPLSGRHEGCCEYLEKLKLEPHEELASLIRYDAVALSVDTTYVIWLDTG